MNKWLFIIEFHDRDDIEEQAVGYIEGIEECTQKDASYMLTKLKKIVEVVDDIDKIIEDKEYNKKKWTKIFKPAMTYVGSATLSSYISDWICNLIHSIMD